MTPTSKKPKKPAAAKPKPYARRDDLNENAGAYYAAIPKPFRAIAARVRQIVRKAAPEAVESIKWGMPVYVHHGLLAYVRFQSSYLTLGFYEAGTSLGEKLDPDGLLEGTGAAMRHVKIRAAGDVRPALFARWVAEAAAFNELSK
jgi:hypothetical protein